MAPSSARKIRDAQREYRVYAAGPAAVAVREQDGYGVVDVGLRGALATKNADAGNTVYLPAPATITPNPGSRAA